MIYRALDPLTGSPAVGTNVINYNAHINAPSRNSYLILKPASDNDLDYISIRLANYMNKYYTANQDSKGTSDGKDINAKGNVYWCKGGLADYRQAGN